MGVLADATGQALAKLSADLTAGSAGMDVVMDRAARAVVDLVGEVGGVRLLGDEGYGDPVVHHDQLDQARWLADLLRTDGTVREAAVGIRTARQPAVITPGGGPTVLLCPLTIGEGYLGYLAVARTATGQGYEPRDIAVVSDIASRIAPAIVAARSVSRLHAVEQQYRSIVATALEGVWQLDPDGVTTFANQQLATIVGLPPERLIGRPVSEFFDARGQAQLAQRLTEPHGGPQDGPPEPYEARLLRADGSSRWVQISAAPVCRADPEPEQAGPARAQPESAPEQERTAYAGSLLMIADITERVQARELKRQLDHLRRLDSLGQLVGGIAHDFKNLFTVIAGSAEVIAEATHHQLADQIVDATVRGRALTHQLLAFGRGGGRPELISLADLLDDVQQLLSRTLGEQIRLEVNVEPDLWPVRAERGPLEQVVINLAVNARDAMARGGTLLIEATNVDLTPGELTPDDHDDAAAKGRFVRLSLSDTGAGMTPETRRRAFEPFFTTRPTAAGLGLTTAHSVVCGSGGDIRLESEPGIGTTVQLYLPAGDRPGAGGTAGLPASGADQAPRRGNILVVEDQRELAELIRYLLQPAGYTVRVVTTVGEAIAHVNAGVDPDLLLTDVVMPGMTGPELATALRARKPELRVLYMSGYSAAELSRQGGIEHGGALIQKPFNRDTLLAAVDLALIAPPPQGEPPTD